MLKIDLLKNHPESIARLTEIWHEVLGKIWMPYFSIEYVFQRFHEHLNDNSLPLTFVGFDSPKPIGMCSLRTNECIRPELTPWLGSLVVDPNYQHQGIGQMLIDTIKAKAKKMGYMKLYLCAFDPTIPNYYHRLGWVIIGMDEFRGQPLTVMEITL